LEIITVVDITVVDITVVDMMVEAIMGGIMTVTTVPMAVAMAMGCLRVGIMGELAAQIAGC